MFYVFMYLCNIFCWTPSHSVSNPSRSSSICNFNLIAMYTVRFVQFCKHRGVIIEAYYKNFEWMNEPNYRISFKSKQSFRLSPSVRNNTKSIWNSDIEMHYTMIYANVLWNDKYSLTYADYVYGSEFYIYCAEHYLKTDWLLHEYIKRRHFPVANDLCSVWLVVQTIFDLEIV